MTLTLDFQGETLHGLIDMERKGWESIGYCTHSATLNFDITYDFHFDLSFWKSHEIDVEFLDVQVKIYYLSSRPWLFWVNFENNHISGIPLNTGINSAWKRHFILHILNEVVAPRVTFET